MHGQGAVLQGPGSDVQLLIPEGLNGFIFGHAHTDPTPFLEHIPESECLVSPIAEYKFCSFTGSFNCSKGFFEIIIPHYVKDRRRIRIRHGDIYEGTPFSQYCFYTINEHLITISTSKFSQFICTVD